MINTRCYVIRMRPEGAAGDPVTVEITGASPRGAALVALASDAAPAGAWVEWVRVRPLCGWCGPDGSRHATHVQNGGSDDPWCWDHAVMNCGSAESARNGGALTLGVRRLERLDVSEWGRRLDVRAQYGDATGRDISGDPYAEDDATEVTWWDHDMVWLSVTRTARGLWKITTSDVVRLSVADHDRRHASPGAALAWAGERTGTAVTDDQEWVTLTISDAENGRVAGPSTVDTCDHDRDTCVECVTICRVCGRDHATLEKLAEHVRAAHDVDDYSCGHCGRPGGH